MSREWWTGSQDVEMPRWCWAIVAVACVVCAWEIALYALEAVRWLANN